MGYDAANIGRARVKVEFLPNSPFNGIPQQEFGYYFNQDNIGDMSNNTGVVAIPSPLNSFRLDERLDNYDNYLVDTEGTYLEDAVINVDGIAVPINPGARQNADIADTIRPKNFQQVQFFTWALDQNFFRIESGTSGATGAAGAAASATTTTAAINPNNANSANPQPVPFRDSAARTDNTPTWTYNLKVKPGAGSNASALSPFMTRSAPSPTKPVHWGVTMKTALARNQPFELLFYHDGQVQTVAEAAPSLKPRFQGVDIDLTKKAYFCLEIGKGTTNHFLILLVQDLSPRFYALTGNGNSLTASLIDEFASFNGEKLFDPENSYITLKIEQVGSGLVINSNQFSNSPWIVNGDAANPIFVGEGQLSLYSGNVQAGFLMRPCQYISKGTFTTPPTTIIQLGADTRVPTFTAAIKGVGEVEQNASYKTGTQAEVFAVDAEQVNGKNVKTFIEAQSGEKPLLNGKRRITVTLNKVPNQSNAGNSSVVKKTDYSGTVIMFPTDTRQGNGYLVKNGRSPYIWQLRGELAQEDNNANNQTGLDVSCDCLSCEIAFNSTSYNELNHTGTIKMLNKPRLAGGIDYRGYTNRAVYLRVSAWWENGAGHDPGGDNRVIFEGMSIGATVETKREIETVTFKLEDYMNALEGGKFVLSPYYDGMSAPLAVRDIVKQLGMSDSRILAGDTSISSSDNSQAFVLPFNSPFEEPQFRFKDGSSYKAAVAKIAALDGKTIYFDSKGNFHYDPIPGGIFGDENTKPVVEFFTNVALSPSAKQVAWNMSSFSRQVNDTYNVLTVKTIDKDTGAIVVIGDANDAGIFDATSEGFLGFRKHLMIQDPSLGSVAAAGRYFQNYRQRVFIPPITVRFETYGYSGLKPLDTISLDGQKVRILNLQSKMDAKDNQYYMTIEGEWFFTAGKWQDQTVTNSNQ